MVERDSGVLKEMSGSEKKKSSRKRKGKSAAKRSPSPQDPPTLSSKSIQAKCRNNERLDCSDCSSSGYSFDRKQSKPALRLKMPAKVLHRGKAADVCSGRDGCMIGGSCSSLVRTATGIILTLVRFCLIAIHCNKFRWSCTSQQLQQPRREVPLPSSTPS